MSGIIKREVRYGPPHLVVRLEKRADDKQILTGYPCVTGVTYPVLDFRETVAPGAFTRILKSKTLDTLLNVGHDADKILARAPRTLTLTEDQKGLRFEAEIAPTQLGKDTAISIERGDYRGASFAFTVAKDKWDTKCTPNVRTITEISKLYDVSVVAYPANPQTSLDLRSLLFPCGPPFACPASVSASIRGSQRRSNVEDDPDLDGVCECLCDECRAGYCDSCDDEDCDDRDCREAECPMQDDDRSAKSPDTEEAVAARQRRVRLAFSDMGL